MSLEKFIARQKEITKNLQLQESSYARRYRFYDIDQDANQPYGLDEEEPLPDEPAQEPVADAGAAEEPFDAQPGGEEAPAQDFADPAADGGDAGAEGGDVDTSSLDSEFGGAPADDAAGGDDMGADPAAGGDEEVDVTELVNGTQEVSSKVDGVLAKLDQSVQNIAVISQSVNGLEGTLSNMQNAIQALTTQVQLMRPPTEEERRKVVKQTSYPFNQDMSDVQSGTKQTQTDLEDKSRLSMQNILSTYNDREIRDTF